MEVTRTIISAITSIMLFVGVLHAEYVRMPPLESSRHVRIQVVLAGNPVKGAKVIIRASHECTCATDTLRGNPLDTTTKAGSTLQITAENGLLHLPEFS